MIKPDLPLFRDTAKIWLRFYEHKHNLYWDPECNDLCSFSYKSYSLFILPERVDVQLFYFIGIYSESFKVCC